MKTMYTTVEELSDAIDAEKEDGDKLRMYLDGGEVIINNENGDTIFGGSEQQVLIDLVALFLGVEYEQI